MGLADQLGAVDPQGVVTGMLAEQVPEAVQNDTVDPQLVMNRLIRKGLDGRQQKKLERAKEEEGGATDFSAFGRQPSEQAVDFSSYGDPNSGGGSPSSPVDEAGMVTAFGGDAAAKTAASPQAQPPAPTDTLGGEGQTVDVPGVGPVPTTNQATPEAMAVLGKSAARAPIEMAGGALQGAAPVLPEVERLGRASGGIESVLPGENAEAAKSYPEVAPASDSSLYKAGTAVKEFAERAIPISEQERKDHGIAASFGGGVGGMLPLVAAGLFNPPAAIVGGAALFGLSGAGQTYEAAKANGADEQTALHAAALSGAVNTALGGLPLASVLNPVSQVIAKAAQPYVGGVVANILAHAAQNGIVFASVGEAQEFVGQQIAKLYNSKAGYDLPGTTKEATERLIGEFLAGAVLGGGHAALNEALRGAQQPPGTGTIPFTPLGQGGEGGIYKGQGYWGPHPETGENTWFAREGPFHFSYQSRRPGGPTEEEAAAAGQRYRAAFTPEEEAPPPFKSSMSKRKRGGLEDAAFQLSGQLGDKFSAQDIASWDDAKLKSYVTDGFMRGGRAKDTKANRDTTQGTADNPIDIKAPADLAAVVTASTQSTHAQGAANNAPRVHATWNSIPLTFETEGPNNVRRGIDDNGAPWEQPMGAPSGYIKGVKGADGDQLDFSMGKNPESPFVFVLDEADPKTGDFEQHKVFFGMNYVKEALDAYTLTAGKTRAGIGGITTMTIPEFKEWKNKGDTTAPLSDTMKAKAEAAKAAAKVKEESILPEEPAQPEQPSYGGMKPGPGASPEEIARAANEAKNINAAENLTPAQRAAAPAPTPEGPLAPDQPSAEPLSDLKAQLTDLKDKDNHRAAVWLPASSVQHIQGLGLSDDLIKGHTVLNNFDGKGGVLIARDAEVAKQAEADRAKGIDNQIIVGRLTGTGEGKSLQSTHAVQQRDEHGNVTRESVVPRAQLQATVNALAAPHRTVHVLPLKAMLERRANMVAAEAGPQDVGHHHVDAIENALTQAGVDPTHMRPADIRTAAEIHAEEGAPPVDAVLVATVRNLVKEGHITPEELAAAAGGENEASTILEPGGGAQRGPRAETHGAAVGGPATPAAEGEPTVGAQVGAKPPAAAKAAEHKLPEAPAGTEAAGGTGGAAAAEHQPAGERRPNEVEHGGGGELVGAGEQAAPERKAGEAAKAHLIGEPIKGMPEYKVTAANGKSIQVVPVIVELDDLIASSDKGYDLTLQPRQQDRASRIAHLKEIATNYDPYRSRPSPEADRGAPLADGDRQIISGNGRIAVIRALYASGRAGPYLEMLRADGVDVEKYNKPGLIGQIVTPLSHEELKAFAVAANQPTTLAFSSTERAMADAEHLTPAMIGLIHGEDLSSAQNRPFIRAFVKALPASERGNIANDKGALSAEGLARAKNAILAKAYGDPAMVARITESTDSEVGSIANALVAAAPEWAKLRAEVAAGRVRRDMDLTDDLLEAVKRTADLRSRGQKLEEALAQQDALDQIKTSVEGFMRMFYDPKGRRAARADKIADRIRFYVEQARQVTNDPRLGLDIPEVSHDELQRAALEKTEAAAAGAGPGNGEGGNEGGPATRRPGAGKGGKQPAAANKRAVGGGFAEEPNRLAEGRPETTPTSEATPIGDQYVIPGAERIPSAELAKRKAAEPLKPSVAQKPLASLGGLFDEIEKQVDLEEAIRNAAKKEKAAAAAPKPAAAKAPAVEAKAPAEAPPLEKPAGASVAPPATPTPKEAAKPSAVAPEAGQTDAFPDKIATPLPPIEKPAVKPKLSKKQKDLGPSLFDWEKPNEHPRTPISSPAPLEGVAPPTVPTAKGGGAPGGRTARGGTRSPEGNRTPDEVPTLFGPGSEGGSVAPTHPQETGAGGGEPGLGAGGTGTDGSGLPKERGPVSDVKPEQAPSVPAINYRITDETELGKGSEGVKFRDNVAAIQTLKLIETENRRATPEEQRALARYVGWGGLANAFPDMKGEFKPDWEERGRQLQTLLDKDEHRAAAHSTLNAHYTSREVIDAMWKAAQHLGFKGGLAFESSMGTGNFLGLIPEKLAGKTRFIGVELDSITARIAKALYPQETVLHTGLQNVPLPDGEFVLSIGNPPFGSESLRFQHRPELQGISIHNQFFLASLDVLKPGGVHIAVVSHYLLDSQDSAAREKMAIKADLLGAIRLPDTAFKENARTEVVTDIVVMKRRTRDEERGMTELYNRMKAPGRGKDADTLRRRAREEFAERAPWVETTKIKDPLGGEDMPVNQYFDDHPDMVMGRIERSGTMRGPDQVNVKLDKKANLGKLLNEAVKKLPEGALDIGKDVVAQTIERYKNLSDSIQIALHGHEPGHIEFNDKGQLTQISERETPSGEYEPTRRVLDANTPWSRDLMMDANGNYFTLEPQSEASRLREVRKIVAATKRSPFDNKELNDEQTKEVLASLDKQIAAAVKSKANAKAGRRLIYERRLFKNNVVPENMRLGHNRLLRLNAVARLRDLLKQQIVMETKNAPEKAMEVNRGKLAAAYRAYTEAHGLLNDPRNMQLLNEMPDGPLLMSLENGYKPAVTNAKSARTGHAVRRSSASPAAILSKRVIPTYEAPNSAASPADAIAITLSERGRLDAERVAQLLGITEDKVGEAIGSGDKPLAFFDPETQTWEARNEYLSGLVRKKLAAARIAGLEKNVKELEAVQPVRWTADQVTPLVGSNWIPPKVYEDFAKHLLGTDTAHVHYSKATNAFGMIVGDYGEAAQAQWGTEHIPADAILRGMLNSRVPKVIEHVDNGSGGTRPVENKEYSKLVVLQAKEIENAFADWVFKDGDRRRELVDIYNDKFNTRVNRQHDGSHLVMPGKNPAIPLRRNVINGIWRGIYERNTLYDHVVGAGKTFIGAGRVMERRRMGLSHKPMIQVPNHLVQQWAAEIYRLYPGAKVLAAGKNQFTRQNRRKLFARIATGDWDAVIVPHTSADFIDISPETELRFLDEQLRLAREAVLEAEEAAQEAGIGGGFRKPYTVKEAERLVESILTRMDKLRGSRRDNMLTFEQMGVDDLTVDEAHEFKNLFYSSRMADVRGMGNKSGSQRAFKLYNKTRVLNESPTGTVTFLTGTPISNSAVEMYTMMRYLAADQLKALGIEHFDAWRQQYVSAEPAWEPTETGGLREVTRLGRSWSNMRALMDLYRSFTDSVTQDDLNKWYAEDNNGADFPIPKVKGGKRDTHVVPATPAQVRILEEVLQGFAELPDEPDPDERNKKRLRLIDRARKVSLDARAVDARNPSKEENGKLETMSNEIARIYKKWTPDKGTQLVFLDRSVPRSRGDDRIIKAYDDLIARRDEALANNDEEAFRRITDALDHYSHSEIEELRIAQAGGWNAYDQIKKNLIARGVPANEIRFIQEANNETEKQAMFDGVNEGSVRVLIGSTQRMGAGTNVQYRIVGLHHGDVGWAPWIIEQREGRGIRQGNSLVDKYGTKNFELEIHNYVTERTIDGKMWDLNSQKLRMINGIRKYDGAFNMDFPDEDATSMAEIAALATGDPLLIERVKLGSEIENLEIQERAFRRKMNGIEDAIDDARRAISDYPRMIEEEKAKSDDMIRRIDDLKASAAKRMVTIEGQTYSDRFQAERAAQSEIARQKGGDENAKYKLTIDGNVFTNKEGIHTAIAGALGDSSPFEAKIDGEVTGSVNVAAKAIEEKIKPHIQGTLYNQQRPTVKIGTLLGADLEAALSSQNHATKATELYVTLVLRDGGKTIAAAQSTGAALGDVGVIRLINTINDLGMDAQRVAASRGVHLEGRLERAQKDLPGLTEQLGQTFPKAAKLEEFRDRLRELVETLAARENPPDEPPDITLGPGGLPPGKPRLSAGAHIDNAEKIRRHAVHAAQAKFLTERGLTWEQAASLNYGHLEALEKEWHNKNPTTNDPLVRVETFWPDEIKADPERFQYRGNVVDQASGVTDRPMTPGFKSSAPMIVLRDPAGEVFVVDGHHRLNRAKELEAAGERIPLKAIVLNESDGITPKMAKDFGERRNEWREATKPLREIKDLDDYLAALRNSEAGIPIRLASSESAETGGAVKNSSGEAPPLTQPLPGSQVSHQTAESPSRLTTRETPPSIFEGPVTTSRFSDFRLGDIEPTSKKNIIQGTNDYNALLDAAQQNKQRFTDRLQQIADTIPGVHFDRDEEGKLPVRVKELEGILKKLKAKGRPANTISDYIGGRLVVDTPAAMHAIVQELGATGAVIEHEDFVNDNSEDRGGYRAVHLQVGLGDGTSAELQLVPTPIKAVMTESHAIRDPVKRWKESKDPIEKAEYKRVMALSRVVMDRGWSVAGPEWHSYNPPLFNLGSGFAEPPDMLKAPPFYSATARAIEAAKQDKAAPNHWLGMLKNTPGVKAEELEWLGLPEWLREHKGPVTKQELGDYVRANQIEVKEVEKAHAPNNTLPTDIDQWVMGKTEALEDDPGSSTATPMTLPQLGVTGGTSIDVYHDPDGMITGYGVFFHGTDVGATSDFPEAVQLLADRMAEAGEKRIAGGPKFSSYVLPGGENYRELLLTLPVEREEPFGEYLARYRKRFPTSVETDETVRGFYERGIVVPKAGELSSRNEGPAGFRSSHWDEPNVLAHVRFNDRTISADGTSYTPPQRTLFIEEIQSDWHQKGKRQGYGETVPDTSGWNFTKTTTANSLVAARAGVDQPYWRINDANGDLVTHVFAPTGERAIADAMRQKTQPGVADAPFKTTWPELAMKRMIRYAAENGYEKIAWTPGEVQAERYDLSKHIDEIFYRPREHGGTLIGYKDGSTVLVKEGVSKDQLADNVGKDVAEKLLQQPLTSPFGAHIDVMPSQMQHHLGGVDLKVGTEGMGGFYDKILPAAVNKLVKKFGGKVGRDEIITPDTGGEVFRGDEPLTDFDAGMDINTPEQAVEVHSLDITPELRRAAVSEGFPLFDVKTPAGWESAPTDVTYSVPPRIDPNSFSLEHHDLGPYHFNTAEPIGRQAQNYILDRGRKYGVEYVLAIDKHGRSITHGYGNENSTGQTAELTAAMHDPNAELVIHHNHPTDSNLSSMDLAQLARPGVHSIWAHGHGGNVSRAELTPEARERIRTEPNDSVALSFYNLFDAMERSFVPAIQHAVNAGMIGVTEGKQIYSYMLGEALQRAGFIKFHSSNNHADMIDRIGLDKYIDRAARLAHGGLFNGRTLPDQSDRRPDALRHIADLGATFSPASTTPSQYRPQGRNDRQGRAIRRREAPEQISLPGFAEPLPRQVADSIVGFTDTGDLFRKPDAMEKKAFPEGLSEGGDIPQGFADPGNRFRPGPGMPGYTPPPPRAGPQAAAGGAGGGARNPPPPPGGGGTTAPGAAPRPPSRGRPITGAITSTETAKRFKNFWSSTFQPDLFSDRAFMADPLFARYRAASAQEDSSIVHQSEKEWDYWNKRGWPERREFLASFERNRTQADATKTGMARRYGAMLDANWALEKQMGSQAGYVKNYISHVWEKPGDWDAFSDTRSKQVGGTWFQKERFYDYIEEGLAAGLKLKYTNPVDLVVHRLLSGVDMRQQMHLLYDLKRMGLASEYAKGGEHLNRRGWRTIDAPDRHQWVIAPDVRHLWKNAVEAKGLWQADHAGGSIFRGWMVIKGAWIPVRLAASAFHPLHVLHINYSNGMAQAWDDVVKGKDPIAAIKSLSEGFVGPMRAAPGAAAGTVAGALIGSATGIGPYWGGMAGAIAGSGVMKVAKRLGVPDLPHEGKTARSAWLKRMTSQRMTPDERAIVTLMNEGGFVPQLSEQFKINTRRQMAEAWQKVLRKESGVADWRKLISGVLREPVRVLQKPIFEDWIPNIKTAAYLSAAAALLKREPDLLNDNETRRVKLRALGQQIDSRFGEKFYGSMFWNRYVKDTSVATFLSLGWNYGFVDQFLGAAMEAVTRPAGLLPMFKPSEGRAAKRSATNKLAFAIAYLGSAALINGLMTLAYTGETPHGLDWIFARTGGLNPDGNPRRLANMFYLREAVMWLKHVQERGGNMLSGSFEMLTNKLLVEPFKELLNNRDYFGYNIWDENAPLYKQIWQGLKHTLSSQIAPMGVTGGSRAAELSGKPFPSIGEAIKEPSRLTEALGAKGVGESIAGFGPAPSYAEKSAMQNRIGYLYSRHVTPESRPEAEGETAPDRMAVRTAIMLARQNNDSEALQKAYAKGHEIGMKQSSMSHIGRQPSDVYMFSRLPNSDQQALLEKATPAEYELYFRHAHGDVKQQMLRQREQTGAAAQ